MGAGLLTAPSGVKDMFQHLGLNDCASSSECFWCWHQADADNAVCEVCGFAVQSNSSKTESDVMLTVCC